MIDAFARPGSLVVRANGGAQAGHTVQRPDGTRHVFHHVGSGALQGAATLLSRFYVHNPLLLEAECEALATAVGIPEILADPSGQVTTPWDMMINQIAEEIRGCARHGSCGLGINETLRRGADEELMIRAGDLGDADRLARAARRVQQEWVPARLAELELVPDSVWRQRLASPVVLEAFLNSCARFSLFVQWDEGTRAVEAARRGALLFEGAQGLLLDQDHAYFPHVTPSKTGLHNPSRLAREWGIHDLQALYVTRAYATRHGAGPFPREVPDLSFPDPTNVPNAWQGSLRFGALDLDLLRRSIDEDQPCPGIAVEKTLAMTCLDQVGDGVTWWQDGLQKAGAAAALAAAAPSAIGVPIVATSHGPCRENVRVFSRAVHR